MLSLHEELSHSVYGFTECEQTPIQGRANIVWKMKTGKIHYLHNTSLKLFDKVEFNSVLYRRLLLIKNKISQKTP